MPTWAHANLITQHSAACRGVVVACVVFLAVALGLPSLATVYNSQNPNNPQNQANPWTEDIARKVGIAEKTNSSIPQDITLIDEAGQLVELGSFFKDGRPIIFNIGYSRCPSICPAMRKQLIDTLPDADLALGEDAIVLNLSIDPEETPETSAKMREQTLAELKEKGVEASADGWRFLTGTRESIEALTDAVGYRYLYIEPQNEYGHPSVLVLADGQGIVRRYLSGTAYSGKTLRLSVVETSEGKVGSFFEQAFVTCFVWDDEANNYTATASFLMMTGGGVIMLFIGGLVLAGFAYEKRRRALLEQGQAVDKIESPAAMLFGGWHRRRGRLN